MIRFSVNIMRGCFGGCTFCSITEHEGRIIQSRSEASILNEIENIRDKTPGFTGMISDLGGPTANMYRLNCSCVYPTICSSLNTDHSPTTQLYRKARDIEGVKKIAIASGLRYDLAIEDPEYVKESDEDMMNLALWLKQNKFRLDQVQNFYPSPMATASTMYITEMNPLKPVKKGSNEIVFSAKTKEQRRLHRAFLRYHDPDNWPLLRKALKRMGKANLIGKGKMHLVPSETAREKDKARNLRNSRKFNVAKTQHLGLPKTPQKKKR